MNRLERRKLKNRIKGNVMLSKGVEPVDHKNDQWCHLHKLNLDNAAQETERDKRLIASIAYKTIESPQDDGTIKLKKVCPRCWNTVEVDTIRPPLLR